MGVLAGPSVVGCFNSSEGMGVCLRGEMTDAGILPPPPDIASPQEAAPQEPVADVAVATPQLDVTPPTPALTPEPAPAVPDDLIAATFGLLRAEPDGSLVIAGSGRPGSQIEVYSNGELIGTATVEPSGDWVLVPERPLPPGGTELTLAEVGKPGTAAQSFVVVINDDRTSEPLVVASTPGAASEILQGLERPAAGTSTQVAVAESVEPIPAPPAEAPVAPPPVAATPAPAATPEPQVAAVEPAPQPSTPAVTPPAATPPVIAETPAPVVAAPAAPSQPTPEATLPVVEPAAPGQPEPIPAIAEPAEPAIAAAPEPAPVTPAPVEPVTPAEPVEPAPSTPAMAAPVPSQPAAPQPETAVALAEPAQPAPAPVQPVLDGVPPSIDAVEIEGARNFFAGGGPERAVMRLYVDGQYIADATVAGGRWLVESANVLTKPLQRIRIDMLKPGTADVAARAEVDFVVELPEEPVAVAAAPQPQVTTPEPAAPTVAEPATPPADEPAPQVAIAEPVPAAPVEPTAVHPTPHAPMTAATEPAPVATAEPTPVEAARTEPVAPAEPAPVSAPPVTAAAEPVPPEPAPVAVAEAASAPQPAVPTLVAVQVGAPGDQRFASGKAIIRRGDNLWMIARRVYGQGIKYTTIYEANDGQIRNPSLIYPGQVFDLPEDQAQ